MRIVYPKTKCRTTGAGAIAIRSVIQKFDTFNGFRGRFAALIVDNVLKLRKLKKY
jgi:hypothetical protein